jgi:hypothetical protein
MIVTKDQVSDKAARGKSFNRTRIEEQSNFSNLPQMSKLTMVPSKVPKVMEMNQTDDNRSMQSVATTAPSS